MDHASSPLSLIALLPPARISARIRRAHAACRRVPREELSPAGMWIEDHARFLLQEALRLREALKNAPRLPGSGGQPRMARLAQEICREGSDQVSAAAILRISRAFFADGEPAQQELCMLRDALACALLDRLGPVLHACMEEAERRRQAERFTARLGRGKAPGLPENPALQAQIIVRLSAAENAEAMQQLDGLLQKGGVAAREAMARHQAEQTRLGQEAGSVIAALHALERLPFDRIIERLSPISAVLRQEETYRRMDAESRNFYIARVCLLARRLHVGESAVARAAMALREGNEGPRAQCGFYLIEQPEAIGAYLLSRKPGFFARHREGAFSLALGLGACVFLALGMLFGAPWYTFPGILLCGSELTRRCLHALLRRRFPARLIPRLRIRALSPAQRTLIVVPTLLVSRKQALHMARQLSVLRCASPEKNLEFMLLGDFADSAAEAQPQDQELLAAASAAVDALNAQYGGGFFYLHRARRWDGGQRRFTGRERKRGALEALNLLLTGRECPDAFDYASCDLKFLRERYAYVITLDADTFLPAGAALALIGAMEHPLQKGRIGVIQPRMAVAPDTVRTRAQRLLGGRGGADPYHLSAQDLYQDVFGKGSFVGKGIYQPAYFLDKMAGRVPAGRLLSHDLIEGEIAGSALAEDIVLYDGHPARLSGWQKRLHRWTRGDWQLLPFLGDRRLSLLSRLKIHDNLRRSLLPAAQAGLLLLGAGLDLPLLCLLGLPWPIRGMGLRLLLLPAKAYTLLDAAIRALYRQLVSHQGLLSWVTAAQAESTGGYPLPCVLAQIGAGTGMIILSLLPGGFLPAVFVGLWWVLGPLLGRALDAPEKTEPALTPVQREDARALARNTWQFFERHVTKENHFLPPDNVQLDPDKGEAHRTSPTNIGLYLLSCVAARELGLITTAQMASRMDETLATLESLETWHGHLCNWYDTQTLSPLPPAFVSTVDSGNLAGCLLCCAQACRERLEEMAEAYRALPARLDALATAMDFSTLYDKEAGLFAIGYDLSAQRLAPAHYDLLASEARLASFVAVMEGQVPRRHWQRLGRSCVRAGGGAALLSWGGTMFEYLMPGLLLPLIPGTLLGEGCMYAIKAQISAAGQRPFGVSESGYYAFDPDLNYQYKAFGLPALALSGETAGSVVAPYASMLAMPYTPRAAGANLAHMRRLKWLDDQGLFEAADFSPQRVGKGPGLVMSHMAHHQGMILCALCNALTDFSLVRHFMSPPRAQASVDLLWERPSPLPRRQIFLPPPREESYAGGAFPRAAREGLPVDAHALFGGGTTWLLSGNGQGYLSHQGMLITRFFPEADQPSGPQFYLQDEKSGGCIRIPVRGKAVFSPGKVDFQAQAFGLNAALQCCVEPLTGMAVAALTLENPGKEGREATVCSFLEIAQGDRAADEAHPNFRDLSVQIAPFGSSGLLSRRLPRDEKDEMPLICHTAAGDIAALRRQGDRLLFLGRDGSYDQPAQLQPGGDETTCRLGDVIAPCLSLQALVRLPADGTAHLYFFIAVGKTEEALAALSFTPAFARSAFSLSATQARMALRFLHMDGRMLALYQQLLGAVSFSGQPHQCALPSAPPAAFWRFGIAGVLPVLLVRLYAADKPLIRHVLRAHSWMRAQGVWIDLVFACQEEGGYARPVQDTVNALLSASPDRELRGASGGVHVVACGEEESAAMESRAALTLRSGMALPAQLSALRLSPPAVGAALTLPIPVAPPPLWLDNGFGGFTPDRDYAVYALPPAPWHNILANGQFGTVACESGVLQSFGENSRLSRVTRPAPDVHRPRPAEEIYLRCPDGRLYPLCRPTALHAPGVTTYQTKAGDVYAEVSLCCPEGMACGARIVTLRSEKPQKLRLHYLVRFALGEQPAFTRCRAEGGFAFARSGDSPIGWAALDGGAARALCPALCFGLQGQEAPCLSPSGPDQGSMALCQRDLTLKPHEPLQLLLAVGIADSPDAARAQFAALLRQGGGDLLRAVRGQWDRRLSALCLYAADAPLEAMLNRWLPYQALAARLLARTGPYQTGGAFGFRDQLQDLLAVLHTDPAFARAHILRCAAHQFPEGDVQHWWHAPQKGVRTRISDDKLFLPYLTALYVRITGDAAILDADAPYLLSAPLQPQEDDRYEEPAQSAWQEPLLRHCLRAIDSVALGMHGLPLMGSGDWNDGMNRIGGRQGESVWLGFFLALVLRHFAPLCPEEERARLLRLRHQLLENAESAWAGPWYLRAWNDAGQPIGGPDTQPPRIDLISQAFAMLAGAPRDHARSAVLAAARLLYDRAHGIVKLLSPPFALSENAGYIGAYIPGVRENGGQYTHAVPWLIAALCQAGESALAWEIARALLPLSHSDTPENARVYRLEPYVLCGDVYAGQNPGRGGWSWYTGSAAWLYYVWFTVLLGFEKQGNQARLVPQPAPNQEEFTIVYRFGTAEYHFTAARDVVFPTLDGEKLDGGWATLQDDGRTHECRFPMKRPQ